jgi:hypothetical protein
MKNLKFLAIMACAIFTLSSCETEKLQGPSESNLTLKEKTKLEKSGGGGEEEELIIIYGVTQNTDNGAIENAEISIFESTSMTELGAVFSDSQGLFQFSVEAGTYYFQAEATGFQNYQTGDIIITDNSSNITLTLEE